MVFDATTSLEALRQLCKDTTPASLLTKTCPPSILPFFNHLTREFFKKGSLRLGNPAIVINIMRELEKHGVTRALIDSYCRKEFDDDIAFPCVVIEILSYVFELDIGVFWSPGEFLQRCPYLEFDDDGLMIGPSDRIRFQRDGVRSGLGRSDNGTAI